VQVITDEELRAANPIVALLRTLLPWVNVEGAAPQEAPEIPQPLWGQALDLFPALAEHLSEMGMHADAEELQEGDVQRIGREIAAFLLSVHHR
jgi:hypothetical protein